VTGLTLGREEEDGFVILVLEPGEGPPLETGDIVCKLSRRVGIQGKSGLLHDFLQPVPVVPIHQSLKSTVHRGVQHAWLREGELKHGIVRNSIRIDELLQYVLVGTEREDLGHDTNRFPGVPR
jgi:hypothetical protein